VCCLLWSAFPVIARSRSIRTESDNSVAVALLSYSTKVNDTFIDHVGVGWWLLNTPDGEKAKVNVTWAELGVPSQGYRGAVFSATVKGFSVDTSSGGSTGLIYALVQTFCYGAFRPCSDWQSGSDSNWQLITIRYKYDDVLITPKVIRNTVLPDTKTLSNYYSYAVIASPSLVFVFDGNTLLRYEITSRGAKVASVTTVPNSNIDPVSTGNYIIYTSTTNALIQYNFVTETITETPPGSLRLQRRLLPNTNRGVDNYLLVNWTMDAMNKTHSQVGMVNPPETEPWILLGSSDDCLKTGQKKFECQAISAISVFYGVGAYTCVPFGPSAKFGIWESKGLQMVLLQSFGLELTVPVPASDDRWMIKKYGIGIS